MPKILIVEDNEENRDVLTRRLERRGYSVLVAVDGQAGITMAQDEHPDVILMDLNLPDVDGWEATKRIKASPQTASIPVIALTAHAVVGDEQRALQAGCNDYHSKPVEFTRLLGQIEALLKSTYPTKDA
jgi:two-component system, cell cycle response regulator DivK